MKVGRFAGFLTLCFLASFGQGRAAILQEGASDWVRTEYGILRIISSTGHLNDQGATLIGVQIRLQPGWKTYWRTPGEAGVPTQFDWEGSKNVASAKVEWPTPRRFSEYEMETFGYEGEVIFPVYLSAESAGEAVDIRLKLNYGVCMNVCIPMESRLQLSLEPKAAPLATDSDRTRYGRHIDRFLKKVPAPNGGNGLNIEHVLLRESDDSREIEVQAVGDPPMTWPDLAVELPPGHRLGIPLVDISRDRKLVRLRMPILSQEGAETIVGSVVSVVVWDEDGRSVEHQLEVGRAPELDAN